MKRRAAFWLLIVLLLTAATRVVFAAEDVSNRSFDGWDGQDKSLQMPLLMPAFATGDTVFEEYWEWGQGLWEIDVNSAWAVGPTSGNSPTVFDSLNCAGTTLGGDPPENTNGYLRRNDLALPSLDSPDEKIILWFAQWVYCYDSNDYGQVRIDSGAGMVAKGYTQWRYSGGWSWAAVDLTEFADSTIDLGFYFYSVNSNNYADDSRQGWYVDNILILKGVIPEPVVPIDWEAGQGNWSASNGNWFVNDPSAGPGTGYRGANCLSLVPWGDPVENVSSYFTSPTWSIPDLGTGADVVLNYNAWVDTYDANDYYRVEASIDGGDWTTVDGPFNGPVQLWRSRSAIIDNCAGHDLRLRFYFRSVNSNNYADDSRFGVSIDHIYFEGLGLLPQDISPYPLSYDVAGASNIRVDFNDAINTSTIDATTFQVTGSVSGPITGSFGFSPDNLAFIFDPDADFAEDEIISCRLTDGVLDLHGLALDGDGDLMPGGDKVWEFSTYDIPFNAKPNPPAGITASVDGVNVLLTWTENLPEENVTEYRIYRAASGADLEYLNTVDSPITNYVDVSGTSGTQYDYVVRAFNSLRESENSSTVCATPGDTEPPLAPVGLAALGGDEQAELTWTSNDECDLVEYWITRREEDGADAVIDTVAAISGEAMSYQDAPLTNFVTYWYKIQAVDNAGLVSEYSESVSAMSEGARADLAVSKAVTTNTPNLFDEVTYTLTVSNHGTDTAPSVVVTDTRDARLAFVPDSAVPSQGTFDNLSGQWNVTELESGASATLNLTFTVQAAADTLWNEAFVTDENSSDLNPDNNTARTWVVGRACDLAVTKTIDNGSPNVGDTVTFTVAVKNLGPNEALGVEVVDDLPTGLTYLPGGILPSRGVWGGNTWSVGNIGVGQSDTLLISAVVDGAVEKTNTAVASSSSPPDSSDTNNSDFVSVNGQLTDLYLVKSVDNVAPQPGEDVTFEVTVTNDGPSEATNVVVTDEIPEGLTLGTHSATVGSYTGGIWTIGTLAANTSATLTLPVTVDVSGSITNSAFISGFDQTDPDPNNGFDFVTLSTDPVDIAVDKMVDRDFANIGETVAFTVTLNNLSPNEASGIQLMDMAAPGLTFVGNTPSAGIYEAGTGIWSVPTLLGGASATLELQATVDRAIEITNTAKIVGLDQADTDKDNNSESVTVTGEAADLALTNTVSPSQPEIDDVVTWVVTVKNNGPSATGNVVISDVLPEGLLLDTHSTSGGVLDVGTMDWSLATLAVDATESLTLNTIVQIAQPLCTTAAITASDKVDTRSDNDEAQACINAVFADLAINKVADQDSVGVAQEVIFTLTVSNAGPNDATGIVVSDEKPIGMTFVQANSPDFDLGSGLWTVGDLTVGSSTSIDITATVDQLGEHDNLAEIVSMNENDENHVNNSNHALVVGYEPPPDVTIAGDYTVNAGEAVMISATATDNTGVVSATLHFRPGTTGAFATVPMIETATPGIFEAEIPASSVTEVGVACFVSAEDDAGGNGYSGYANIKVVVPLITNPSAQPGGSARSAYRIISIPLDLDDPRPAAVLEDDLGTYNKEKWRMFGLNESQSWENSEFPNCGNMEPGRGFFLIVKDAGRVIDAGPGNTVPMHEPYTVSLNQGWNLVGNPYNFDVPVSQISLGSGGVLDARNYLGSWGSLSPTSNFEAWKGYLVSANSDGETLIMDPVAGAGKATASAPEPEVICSVSVQARIGGAIDNDNTAVGVRNAQSGWDHFDRPEPPVIGQYVSVAFPHPDWETPFPAYCRDARPLTESEGQTWDLEVRTNIEGRVTLNFDGMPTVPENMQVWLRDELLQTHIDLRGQAEYSYVGVSNGQPRRLQLVIGTDAFIKQEMPAGEIIPASLVLRANFPNPFNPLTTIRYGVPQEGRVSLAIYDVRGRLVTQLVDEPKAAGYHAVVWDGTDRAGSRVASGVYLYRVVAGGEIKTKKMMLMK